jgi:5-oxoprolinase (ATP-hydrolysing) subunit C
VSEGQGLQVINSGLATIVQDRGRPGYREFGVPVGGAFDLDSLGLANALLGNDRDDAAVELTMVGGLFRATQRLALALAGAPFDAHVDVRRIRVPQSFTLEEGEELRIGGTARGLRVYLAVRGGWRTAIILGSRSSEVRLKGGDILAAGTGVSATQRPEFTDWPDASAEPIRLLDGPDDPVPGALLDEGYRVGGASDRIGIRLEGPPLKGFERPDRKSAPVAPGAIQVAGERAMILGVSGGTMGGYPHVAHVIAADLDRIGQARPGQTLHFARVELAEAIEIDRERRQRLGARDLRLRVASLGSVVG